MSAPRKMGKRSFEGENRMSGSVNKAMEGDIKSDTKFCFRCGKGFQQVKNTSNAQWAERKFCTRKCAGMKRDASDKDILFMYKRGRSCSEIAKIVGISSVHAARIVRKYGATRTASERIRISHSREETKLKLSKSSTGRKCSEHVKDILRERVGSKNHNWRSGITKQTTGYLCFTQSTGNGEHAGKFLHKIIAEWKISRKLEKGEVVHHIDGNKLNNDPRNLEVMTHSDHARLHAIKNNLGRRKNVR